MLVLVLALELVLVPVFMLVLALVLVLVVAMVMLVLVLVQMLVLVLVLVLLATLVLLQHVKQHALVSLASPFLSFVQALRLCLATFACTRTRTAARWCLICLARWPF